MWSVPTLLGALGVLAVGMGFNNPSLTSMVSRLADPDDQGGILGLASSLASLGRVVGPAWGGYLYDAYGMTTPYLSAAALMLIAFVVSFDRPADVDARRRCAPPPHEADVPARGQSRSDDRRGQLDLPDRRSRSRC